MFSFAGDTVVDPFAGTGTTTLAAMETGRNSIAVEIESKYIELIRKRLAQSPLNSSVTFIGPESSLGSVRSARRA